MTAIKSTVLADVQRGEQGLEDELRDSVRSEVATLRRVSDSESEVVAKSLGTMAHAEPVRLRSPTGRVLIAAH
jgi:hypothetical protein